MKTGLFFGSFNPVHIAHMAIANYMVTFAGLDELWFVVSPQNPLKDPNMLAGNASRYEMLKIAAGSDSRFKVSDVEFSLPTPSYTIHTLDFLALQYPGHKFVIVMGSDGLNTFNQWKEYRTIISRYERFVYPRSTGEPEILPIENGRLIKAPVMEVSSTFIRRSIQEHLNISHFLPHGVYEYILENRLYGS